MGNEKATSMKQIIKYLDSDCWSTKWEQQEERGESEDLIWLSHLPVKQFTEAWSLSSSSVRVTGDLRCG